VTPAYTFGETLLRIEDVSLEYQGRSVLKNVNAEVKNIIVPGKNQGQVVGFLGPSGIGKTQLFRIIAGLNRPTSGRVVLNGNDRPVRAGEVGVVAQSYPLFEHRTVFSNLMLAAEQGGLKGPHDEEQVDYYAREFDLTDRLFAYPAQLSGGQRQRTAIIQQLLTGGHFVLMDEPFSGLDLLILEKTCNLITRIAGLHELNTIIVVTHDVTAAALVSDHIWLMGRDTGPDGKKQPGARIVKEYNLIERGLAWRPDLATRPELTDFTREVKNEFRNL
jgi:ABC-type nitrate/sulfonate/bicarbonate transport system ATPase subunit